MSSLLDIMTRRLSHQEYQDQIQAEIPESQDRYKNELVQTILSYPFGFSYRTLKTQIHWLAYSADVDIAMLMVNLNVMFFNSVDLELKENYKPLILLALYRGFHLGQLAPKWSNDKEVVLIAVSRSCQNIRYTDEQLRADRDIILADVSKHGLNLKWANQKLLKDELVTRVAIENHGGAYIYVDDAVKSNKEFIMKAMTNSKGNDFLDLIMKSIPSEMKEDEDIKRVYYDLWDP